jgi:hypothetical protein
MEASLRPFNPTMFAGARSAGAGNVRQLWAYSFQGVIACTKRPSGSRKVVNITSSKRVGGCSGCTSLPFRCARKRSMSATVNASCIELPPAANSGPGKSLAHWIVK